MAVYLVETRQLKSNRKLPVPEAVRKILALDWGEKLVCWNVHTEHSVVVLSSEPLSGDDHADHEFIDYTELLDDGRYIRPPDSLPDQIRVLYLGEDLPEVLTDAPEWSVEELREAVKNPPDPDDIQLPDELAELIDPEQTVDQLYDAATLLPESHSFVYVVYEEMLQERPRTVLLLTGGQFQARIARTPSAFLNSGSIFPK